MPARHAVKVAGGERVARGEGAAPGAAAGTRRERVWAGVRLPVIRYAGTAQAGNALRGRELLLNAAPKWCAVRSVCVDTAAGCMLIFLQSFFKESGGTEPPFSSAKGAISTRTGKWPRRPGIPFSEEKESSVAFCLFQTRKTEPGRRTVICYSVNPGGRTGATFPRAG